MKPYQYCVYAKNIEIYAPIGLYDAEKIIDNHFLINVEVCTNQPYDGVSYIDYEHIVNIVQQCFQTEEKILEAIATNCINILKAKLSNVHFIKVDIQKTDLAVLGQKLEALGVSICKEFGD